MLAVYAVVVCVLVVLVYLVVVISSKRASRRVDSSGNDQAPPGPEKPAPEPAPETPVPKPETPETPVRMPPGQYMIRDNSTGVYMTTSTTAPAPRLLHEVTPYVTPVYFTVAKALLGYRITAPKSEEPAKSLHDDNGALHQKYGSGNTSWDFLPDGHAVHIRNRSTGRYIGVENGRLAVTPQRYGWLLVPRDTSN